MKNYFITVIILSATFIINNFAQDEGWEIVQSGTEENLNSIYFYDYQTGFACGESGVVLKSVDSGKTWQSLPSPVTINLNDCVLFSEDCFRAVGDSALWIGTSDGGNTWFSTQILDLISDIYSLSFSPRTQFFYDGIYGADSQAIMIGSSDYCNDIISDVRKSGPDGFWSAYMLTDKIGFVAGKNSISQPIVGRTTNSGINWDYVSFYLDGNEGRATGVAFTDSLIGYISALVWDGRGAIAKTIDNGDTWTTTFFSNSLNSINFPISGTSNIGYCVGDSGTILKTHNAGVTWQNQLSGTSEKLNKVYFIDPDFGFAVGDNGIILRTTTGGGPVTNIEDEIGHSLNFGLQQNYPNPFNPVTKIKFTIPSVIASEATQFQMITLKIYDILGNEDAILVSEEKPAGIYEVEFDGTGLPSGIYFYKLQAGTFVQTKKMILLK